MLQQGQMHASSSLVRAAELAKSLRTRCLAAWLLSSACEHLPRIKVLSNHLLRASFCDTAPGVQRQEED